MASELLSGSHFSSVSGDERKKRKICFFHSHLRRVLSIRITYCNVGNLPTPKREGNQGRSEKAERRRAIAKAHPIAFRVPTERPLGKKSSLAESSLEFESPDESALI